MSTLFDVDPAAQVVHRKDKLPIALLHQMGCKVCPLAKVNNENPDMPASGSEDPVVYILGEAPGREEDEEGRQFVGSSGQLLKKFIPKKYADRIRYNNVVRTRPFKNETPNSTAIECCRPSVVRDIERTKPKAIFGFGNIPLEWVSGWSGITQWRGRRMPVKIGTHVCWFYPMLHPAYLLRQGNARADGDKAGGDEHMRAFEFDLKRAFAEIRTLPQARVHTPTDVFSNIKLVMESGRKGIALVDEAIDWAIEQKETGFDYETNCLRPYAKKAKILTFAIDNGEKGYAIPLDHPEAQWTEEERDYITGRLKEYFHSNGRKYVHNLAFELEWTGVMFGRKLVRTPNWHDTANQAAIIDERRGKQKPGNFSLEFLVQNYFGFNLKKLSNVDRKRLEHAPLATVLMYNGGDSRYHKHLGVIQRKVINEFGLQFPYQLANRRVPTLVLSSIKGVPVDQTVVDELSRKYSKRIKKALKVINELPIVGKFLKLKRREFNPLSNPDVLVVLRDILKRKECRTEDKYSGKIKYTADEKVLNQIDHPFCKAILALRKATKRKSTYIDPYSDKNEGSSVHPDGFLHATFNSYFAETGRLSAEDPNLQNVPKRDDEAKEVRRQIAALKTKRIHGATKRFKRVIAAFDYGQLESRLIAAASGDKGYIKRLWDDNDIHLEWAEKIAYAYPARVGGRKMLTDKKAMKDFRTDIKNQWTFPLFFGAKLSSVAAYLKIPEEVVKPHYKQFWRTYQRVKEWQDELLTGYHENGYVETLNGRRRRVPLSLNQVINSPIQGTGAEVVMDAMCRLSETGDWDLQPEINIHDDLTFVSMPLNRVDELSHKIIETMLDVPFKWAKAVPWSVEMAIGDNWLELEEVGTFYSHHWFGDKQHEVA